jgi:hypothetical protein
MKEYQKALRLLRRNLGATILFALLLPFAAASIGEDMESVGMVAAALIIFTSISLNYAQKAEKALNAELDRNAEAEPVDPANASNAASVNRNQSARIR